MMMLSAQNRARAISDPYWSQVRLYLPFDGANESTTIQDISSIGHTCTATGSFALTTTQSKFGGSSGQSANNGHVSIPVISGDNPGTSDFTMEGFSRLETLSTPYTLLYGSVSFIVFITDSGELGIFDGGDWYDIFSSNTITTNTWFYWAVTKESGIHYVWLNGVQTEVPSPVYNPGAGANHYICSDYTGAADNYNGQVDCFRYTVGVARDCSVIPSVAFPTA